MSGEPFIGKNHRNIFIETYGTTGNLISERLIEI